MRHKFSTFPPKYCVYQSRYLGNKTTSENGESQYFSTLCICICTKEEVCHKSGKCQCSSILLSSYLRKHNATDIGRTTSDINIFKTEEQEARRNTSGNGSITVLLVSAAFFSILFCILVLSKIKFDFICDLILNIPSLNIQDS